MCGGSLYFLRLLSFKSPFLSSRRSQCDHRMMMMVMFNSCIDDSIQRETGKGDSYSTCGKDPPGLGITPGRDSTVLVFSGITDGDKCELSYKSILPRLYTSPPPILALLLSRRPGSCLTVQLTNENQDLTCKGVLLDKFSSHKYHCSEFPKMKLWVIHW